MTTFHIETLPIPDSADDPDFVAAVAIENAHRNHVLGAAAAPYTPAEVLPSLQEQQYDTKRLAVARVGEKVVGVVIMVWPNDPEGKVTGFELNVAPEFRNQGIGSALLQVVENQAREVNKPVLQVGVLHEPFPDSDMLTPPTGFGAVPMADPGARFLQKHGYTLEQVYRVSVVDLPVPEDILANYEAEAWRKAGDDYRIHVWTGDSPEQWRADLANLVSRLPTDAPSGNLEVDTEPWDAERIRQSDERRRKAGRVLLTAVVEYIPTGELVAFNGISISGQDRSRPAQQGITLVLKEHRGHRLGMLTKVANIRQLMAESPTTPFIITDNAEENRPMLDVNEAVGFRPVAYEGAWQKILTQ